MYVYEKVDDIVDGILGIIRLNRFAEVASFPEGCLTQLSEYIGFLYF